jgi:phage shock protein PspC (stress-responsive transcriptional regulator)
MAKKKKVLFRSESDRMIAGVCAGIAEHFDIDLTIVRVLWILLTLMGFSGVFVYLILWLVIPTESNVRK